MDAETVNVVPEIIVGLILVGFSWAFKNWATTIRSSTQRILEKLEKLALELHEHRIDQEKRVTKLETEVHEVLIEVRERRIARRGRQPEE